MADTAVPAMSPPTHSIAQVRVRVAVALVWLATAITVVLVYERDAQMAELYAAVAVGDVDSVQLVGGLPEGATGQSRVEAHWREGWINYVATAVETSPGYDGGDEIDGEALATPVRTELARIDGDVEVQRERFRGGLTLVSENLPGWLGATVLGVWLTLVFILVNGPVPWRATRWAWFWLVLTPLGQLAFLILSGPTPGVRRPRRPDRPLTGGAAFLLGMLLSVFSLPGVIW